LTYDSWIAQRFQALREELAGREPPGSELPAPIERLYCGLWLYRLNAEEQRAVLERLHALTDTEALVAEVRYLREQEARLTEDPLRPSQVYAILEPTHPAARLIYRVATDSWLARQRVEQFEQRLSQVTTALDGHDLRRMGVKPGPIYRRILRALLEARLDGRVQNREEEEALARAILAEEEAA